MRWLFETLKNWGLGLMMCLKRDNDERRSFSAHFHVIGEIGSWRGLNLLLLFFHLVNSFFLTNKYGGGLGMLTYRLVSFTHVMINEWAIIYQVRRMITIWTWLMRCVSVKRQGMGMPSCMSWFTLSSKSSIWAVGKCCTNDSWGGWLFDEGMEGWLFNCGYSRWCRSSNLRA